MKFNPILLSCLLCLFVAVSDGYAQQYTVEPVLENDYSSAMGWYYHLAKNGIQVHVTVERSVYTQGIYSEYAEKLLGLENVIHQNRINYRIKEVQLRSFTQADESAIFHVSDPKNNIVFQKNEEGILEYIKVLPPSYKGDRPQFSPNKDRQPQPPSEIIKHLSVFNYSNEGVQNSAFTDLNIYEKYDTIYVKETIDSIETIKTILKPRLTSKSSLQKAQELANYIIENKKNREDLAIGLQEVDYAPQTISFMYEILKKNYDETMKSFTGSMSKDEIHYVFNIVPDTATNYLVAYFSSEKGLLVPASVGPHSFINGQHPLSEEMQMEAEDHHYEKIYLQIDKIDKFPRHLANFDRPAYETTDKKGEKIPLGLAYRIPQPCFVKLCYEEYILSNQKFFISQWGLIKRLPVQYHEIKFFPNTSDIEWISPSL